MPKFLNPLSLRGAIPKSTSSGRHLSPHSACADRALISSRDLKKTILVRPVAIKNSQAESSARRYRPVRLSKPERFLKRLPATQTGRLNA